MQRREQTRELPAVYREREESLVATLVTQGFKKTITETRLRDKRVRVGDWLEIYYPSYKDKPARIIALARKWHIPQNGTFPPRLIDVLHCEIWCAGKLLYNTKFTLPDEQKWLMPVTDDEDVALYTLMTLGSK